jgi:MSHA pilin protein MshC
MFCISQRRHGRGFTFVDAVAVIVIVGILAAVAAPRFFDDKTFQARGYYEELAAALKFAQKFAVASGCPVRIEISPGGYEARQQTSGDGSCDPTDASWTTGLAHGSLLSGSSPLGVAAAPAMTLIFDSLGRTDLGVDRVINIGAFALTVSAESGFVDAP